MHQFKDDELDIITKHDYKFNQISIYLDNNITFVRICVHWDNIQQMLMTMKKIQL